MANKSVETNRRLDSPLWFECKMRKANRGQSRLFRFADDFVCCFDYRHEAQAFERAVKERLEKFGLELALDKTKTLRFGRRGGRNNGRFDFLGFEFRWEKSRRGFPIVKRRTSRKKLRGAVQRFTEWIRAHRHQKLKQTIKTVARKHQGHWNYYGLIGNSESLSDYRTLTLKALHKWLNRRSQKRVTRGGASTGCWSDSRCRCRGYKTKPEAQGCRARRNGKPDRRQE